MVSAFVVFYYGKGTPFGNAIFSRIGGYLYLEPAWAVDTYGLVSATRESQ